MNIGFNLGQDVNGVQNFGHQLGWAEHGIVTGLVTYASPESNGLSMLEGNWEPIVAEVGEFIKGGAALITDDGTHQPRVEITNEFVTSAGWAAPRTTWKRSTGPGVRIDMRTAEWAWVNADGTIGTAPGAVWGKTAAQKALTDALLKASAAAAILSA